MGVVETSAKLAERYGANTDKAYIAALFHDACKNLDIDEMNSLVEKYGIGVAEKGAAVGGQIST